jgi:hypothetical protein
MNRSRAIALLLLAVSVFGSAQNKKKHSNVSAVFMNAKYFYVEAQAGDVMRPGLFPEDRQAIFDVQDGMQDWKRYTLTTSRNQADLVFVVRKGRAAAGQVGLGIPGGPRPQGSEGQQTQGRQAGQPQIDDGVGVGAEVGPSDDMLQVYTTNPDGKLIGPVWNREMKDGLDEPEVPLLRQLRIAVEKAYPIQPAPKQP